jgi:hypothetical protein
MRVFFFTQIDPSVQFVFNKILEFIQGCIQLISVGIVLLWNKFNDENKKYSCELKFNWSHSSCV